MCVKSVQQKVFSVQYSILYINYTNDTTLKYNCTKILYVNIAHIEVCFRNTFVYHLSLSELWQLLPPSPQHCFLISTPYLGYPHTLMYPFVFVGSLILFKRMLRFMDNDASHCPHNSSNHFFVFTFCFTRRYCVSLHVFTHTLCLTRPRHHISSVNKCNNRRNTRSTIPSVQGVYNFGGKSINVGLCNVSPYFVSLQINKVVF